MDDGMTVDEAHKVLEVKADTSEAEIRIAYLTKVKQFPPERAPDEFQKIREAYAFLTNPRERARRRWLTLDTRVALAELLDELAPPRRRLGPQAWLDAMGAR